MAIPCGQQGEWSACFLENDHRDASRVFTKKPAGGSVPPVLHPATLIAVMGFLHRGRWHPISSNCPTVITQWFKAEDPPRVCVFTLSLCTWVFYKMLLFIAVWPHGHIFRSLYFFFWKVCFWKIPPRVQIFSKLCFTVCMYIVKIRFFGLSLLFDVIFCVWRLFLWLYLLKQQPIKDQYSASLNLSSRTTDVCPDKCMSTFRRQWGWDITF